MDVQIKDSFEVLTQGEWDQYLGTTIFEKMFLPDDALGESSVNLQRFTAPRLQELIQEYNNKVGSLKVTYALCRHYFDKGIPDEPWFVSPGKNGESVQYFPEFKEEHHMRQYWFTYFSDAFFLKMFSAWDSFLEIVDEFYQYGVKRNSWFRDTVLKKLKQDNHDLNNLFTTLYEYQIYADARRYRNAAAHGTSATEVSNTVQIQRDVVKELPQVVDGEILKKNVRAKTIVSVGVGDYTNVRTIMKNIEDVSRFSGSKIQEAIKLMTQ